MNSAARSSSTSPTPPRGGRTAPPGPSRLSGNAPDAKAVVRELLADLGWPPEWVLDLGDVTSARGTEALMLLVPFVVRARGFAPFAVSIAR